MSNNAIIGLLFVVSLIIPTGAFATPLDCRTGGCVTNQSYAGALINTNEIHPSGTGNFGTFVQIQKDGNEQGYNTTANNVFDNKNSDNFNHEIRASDVGVKQINGVFYAEFVLDANESSNTPEISLDGLQLYISDTPNKSTTTLSSLGTLVYNLDASDAGNAILLDQTLNGSGSGSSDLFFYVPASLFVSAIVSTGITNPYIYLWTQFGLADAASTSDAGFEEWALQSPGTGPTVTTFNDNPVPEPASVALTLLGIGALARRRKMA